MRLCVQTTVRKRSEVQPRQLSRASSSCKFQVPARGVASPVRRLHHIPMLHLLFASSGAFLAPLPPIRALGGCRTTLLLSTPPQPPNRAAASVPARRVRLSSVRLSSAPIGTELVDYLFFIPFALILFALGAGARSVLMGDDGLFSQVTCDNLRPHAWFDPNPDTDPEPSPNPDGNANSNLGQMNVEPDSIKGKIREARSTTNGPNANPTPDP